MSISSFFDDPPVLYPQTILELLLLLPVRKLLHTGADKDLIELHLHQQLSALTVIISAVQTAGRP